MKKAKSTRGFFDVIIAGEFSYHFQPDMYTAIEEQHVAKLKALYGQTLSFEEVTPEQAFDEAGVVTAELSDKEEAK